MKLAATSFVFLLLSITSFSQQPTPYATDFKFFWNSINDEYCYFQKKNSNWQKAYELFAPVADTIRTRNQFIALLEKALNELYDHHAGLNTNTDYSIRLVPSGTDLWGEWVKGKPLITEVRKGFGAANSGIRAGMEVISVNDIPINDAIRPFLPLTTDQPDTEAKNFALRSVLAGNHVRPRKLTLLSDGKTLDFYPDQNGFYMDRMKYRSLVETERFGPIGYIRPNDYLYDNAMIHAFDSAMDLMKDTKGLIIDLRETPSGGNTSVAKAILGWFTDKEKFYQKHEYYYDEKSTGIKRSWEEIVSPRKGKYYAQPLVILCDHWTGSIGEGITIGFDALQRPNTKTIGTPLARLNGAVYSYEMPNTRIHFSFPAERLYHVNGTPRENYVPNIPVNPVGDMSASAKDVFVQAAIAYFQSGLSKKSKGKD